MVWPLEGQGLCCLNAKASAESQSGDLTHSPTTVGPTEDGVLLGTRLWASQEALVHENFKQAALTATGDDTVRQIVTDIARGYDWPARFDARVMRNAFVESWLGQERQLRDAADIERPRYAKAVAEGDATRAAPIVGEGIGLIRSIEPAAVIIERMVAQAEMALRRGARAIVIEEE